jgi:hypothetical protein
MYLERLSDYGTIWDLPVEEEEQPTPFVSDVITLPVNHCPEWVSIDIRGKEVMIVEGYLYHECTPCADPGWGVGSAEASTLTTAADSNAKNTDYLALLFPFAAVLILKARRR